MLPTERLDYSPISERKPLVLPDGARLAVWIIVNVEEWDINETMPRTVLTPPAGGAPMPDIPNWAWHEYGNRVGFWRMLDLFDDFRIPAVLAINGSAIAPYGAGHGAGRAPLHHGRAAPPQIFPRRARAHPAASERFVLDRRADPRLVPRPTPLNGPQRRGSAPRRGGGGDPGLDPGEPEGAEAAALAAPPLCRTPPNRRMRATRPMSRCAARRASCSRSSVACQFELPPRREPVI